MVINTSITKAECEIISFFIANMQKEYGIREVSRKTGTDYKNAYNTIQKLAKKGALLKRRQANIDLCSLSLKGNFAEVCFVEAIRAKAFLEKHGAIKSFFNAVMEKTRAIYYSLVVFGSFTKEKETKSSDLDLLIIAPEKSMAEEIERVLNAESVIISSGTHVIAISETEFIANLTGKKPNVISEAFKSHIILTGAEAFYQGVRKANEL